MFNINLRKAAEKNHEYAVNSYNSAYEIVTNETAGLYETRKNAISIIDFAENIINSIANSPKEFETKVSSIKCELNKFTETEELAKKHYEDLKKTGIDIATGASLGIGVATMTPTVLMGIATTFGTASTGTAISALSGAAAQKAAVAWIGRVFAKFAITKGAGLAVGRTVLALAGPIGWGITAASVGKAFYSLYKKNEKMAERLQSETKEIIKLKNELLISKRKIEDIWSETKYIINDITIKKEEFTNYYNADYHTLSDNDRHILGTLVNNTYVLSVLINTTIEDKEE